MGGCYADCSPAFNRGALWDMSRCIKANMNDAAVIIEYDSDKI